jgi:hypothetical protein
VARHIIEDTVRVDGEGNATIHEVQLKKEYLDSDKVTSKKVLTSKQSPPTEVN